MRGGAVGRELRVESRESYIRIGKFSKDAHEFRLAPLRPRALAGEKGRGAEGRRAEELPDPLFH